MENYTYESYVKVSVNIHGFQVVCRNEFPASIRYYML